MNLCSCSWRLVFTHAVPSLTTYWSGGLGYCLGLKSKCSPIYLFIYLPRKGLSMKSYLMFLCLTLVPLFSVAHEQPELEVTTPTGFTCELEYGKRGYVGGGNCLKGDLVSTKLDSHRNFHLACDLKTLKQFDTKRTEGGRETLTCLYSGTFAKPRE